MSLPQDEFTSVTIRDLNILGQELQSPKPTNASAERESQSVATNKRMNVKAVSLLLPDAGLIALVSHIRGITRTTPAISRVQDCIVSSKAGISTSLYNLTN
jgi:hypothetical protein